MTATVSPWGIAREEVRRPGYKGRLGRQVAERLASRLRTLAAQGSPLRTVGSWGSIWDAAGLERPSDRAARAALDLLAGLTVVEGLVTKVRRGVWRIASRATGTQLGLFSVERNAETSAGASERAPSDVGPAAAPDRAPTRSRLEGPAAALLRVVTDLRAVEQGWAWAVTLTAPDGADIEQAARRLDEQLRAAGATAELHPEVSDRGRLHYHGIAIIPEHAVDPTAIDAAEDLHRWADQAGVGERSFKQITDSDRLDYWVGYMHKGRELGAAWYPIEPRIVTGGTREERQVDERTRSSRASDTGPHSRQGAIGEPSRRDDVRADMAGSTPAGSTETPDADGGAPRPRTRQSRTPPNRTAAGGIDGGRSPSSRKASGVSTFPPLPGGAPDGQKRDDDGNRERATGEQRTGAQPRPATKGGDAPAPGHRVPQDAVGPEGGVHARRTQGDVRAVGAGHRRPGAGRVRGRHQGLPLREGGGVRGSSLIARAAAWIRRRWRR